MSGTVSVRDLKVSAVIGVHDWEREITQVLTFAIDMAVDVARAAASDDVADAVDYSAVAATVTRVVQAGEFRLIETAAERVAATILEAFPAGWVRVQVAKPIAPEAGTGAYSAVITVERGTEG